MHSAQFDIIISMNDQGFDRPGIRLEASLQFGNELVEAIQHVDEGLIITGPSQSGKTVLATALTTIGLASSEIHTQRGSYLPPDLSFAGYSIDPSEFLKSTQEDLELLMGNYFEHFQKLPPIVMIDEVIPEYVPFLTSFVQRINEYYITHNIPKPHLIWVLQGNEPDEMINGDFKGFQQAHHIELQKKPNDPNINNAGYRSAASRIDTLQQTIGVEKLTSLVQQLKAKLSN